MSRLPPRRPDAPSFYGEWRVVDEHEFMSPTVADVRTESEYSQAVDEGGLLQKELHDLRSTLTSPQNDFTNRLEEINRETAGRSKQFVYGAHVVLEQLDRARQKFLAIETTWRKNNFQRYLDDELLNSGQHLSHVDRKLAQAVREVVEMKRDAETALIELTKSVASVDSLIGKTNRLNRSSRAFMQKANAEKNATSLSLKAQLFIAALLSFAGYTLMKYLGW
ncbi:hypothetical protein BBBOND_0304010 [Babesia bigemina]|uniref:Uncharacterized protein n=1 Tax=Babesia bigemina TaxID=5866 RepID=A0A061D942_BABBI|nr:hypothetical protein BBBOND_0304010 [Babesia bigemina]CDR96497.1 hypothetical protein BBBOND_0304010 [Babesia bigemina]|eukprot:XP_012768683.1 hypothetical protein BBBOND_0304010 [Babesia bigemina]